MQQDVLDHGVIEALGRSGGTTEPAINGMRIDVLDSGNGGATHAFDTHGRHPVNAGLRSSESMIQGVGGSTIGLATGATPVTPSSSTLESVKSKADYLMRLTAFWTIKIGTRKKRASTLIQHGVTSKL